MKKWISFMMILFLAVIFVGCGDKPDKPNPKPNDPTEIKVTSIEVTGVKEELEEGESFTLEIKVLPENATNKNYRVAAVDTSVLKVEDKKVTALKGGETTLTVTPLGNTQLKKEFKITVKGKEAPIEIIKPETFTIGGKQEVEKGKTTALSITATPDKANKEATWSSSDESIATVNNGIVKGVELGEVTITATSTLNPLVKAEYKIKVVEAIDKPIIQPTSITLTGDEELEIGYEGVEDNDGLSETQTTKFVVRRPIKNIPYKEPTVEDYPENEKVQEAEAKKEQEKKDDEKEYIQTMTPNGVQLVEKITLYVDIDNSEVYGKNYLFKRFNMNKLSDKVVIDGFSCYKMANDYVEYIVRNQNNNY